MNKLSKVLIILFLSCLIFIVCGCGKEKKLEVNLNDYIEYEFTGTNGDGRIETNHNTEAAFDFVDENTELMDSEEFPMYLLLDDLLFSGDWDKDSGLSNGDQVVYHFDISDDVNSRYNSIKFKWSDIKVNVTGLSGEKQIGYEDDYKSDESEESDESDVDELVDNSESGYIQFEASQEWKNYSVSDFALQIDDEFYVIGRPMEEIMKLVEESSVDYSYDYNKDMLVTGKSCKCVEIKRDGEKWFDIYVNNYYNDTTVISELPVTEFVLSKEAMKYGHFFDGISYEEIVSMTYPELQEYIDSSLSEMSYREMSGPGRIECECSDLYTISNADWTGYLVNYRVIITFYIDENTSQVTDFIYNYSSGNVSRVEKTVKFADLSADEKAYIDNEINKAAEKELEGYDYNYVGQFILRGHIQPTIDYYSVYEYTDDEGATMYICIGLYDFVRKGMGGMYYEKAVIGDRASTIDKAISDTAFWDEVLDTTFE